MSAGWKQVLHRIVADVEAQFDQVKNHLGERFDDDTPLHIVPYRDYGTPTQLRVRGRVLAFKGRRKTGADDSVWRNLLAAWRRFESDEVPGARVRVQYQDCHVEVVADEEGYFTALLDLADPPPEVPWLDASVTLLSPLREAQPVVEAQAPVRIPSSAARFGIISDIDDTILRTDATSLLQMARLTFLENEHTRLPFAGAAALYQALIRGTSDAPINPIFYVSSSPWNLYDLLTEFMRINEIPAGPLLLRDLGFDREKFIKSGHHGHKLAQIERVLRTYESLPFLLIGDSGQEDPAIYEQVIRDFPGRIEAVYIRDVSDDLRDDEVRAHIENIASLGVDMVLVPDSAAVAQHAIARGFLPPEAGPIIDAASEADRNEPGPLAATILPED